MSLKVTKTVVWAAEISDQPGGLAQVLKTLADAGAGLECVIARRRPDKPGSAVAFVTPLAGKKALAAALSAGFHARQQIATLKVEGLDRPGLGAQIAAIIGDAGVSMRGVSAAVIGNKFVCYIGFDQAADAQKAAVALRASGRKRR